MRHFTKSLGAVLLTLFTSAIFAQNNPIVSYRFNPDFSPKDSSYYTYNSQDKLTEKHIVAYDANAQTWNNSLKETYLIDGQGNVLSKLTFTWKNNAWEESFKTTNTHTNNQLMVSIIETKTTQGWVKLTQNEFTYTQGGKIDSLYIYKFDDQGIKEKNRLTIYGYTTGGDLADRLIKKWNSSNSTWDETAKWTYLYDFNDKLFKEEEDNFIGGQWFHIHHYKYNYSSDDKLRIKEHINSATNTPIDKEGYKYEGEETFVAVTEIAKDNNVILYPNPFSNSATLSWDAEGIFNIDIKDISGKSVKNFNNITAQTQSINAKDFKQGIYIYTIKNTTNGQQTIGKFVITR